MDYYLPRENTRPFSEILPSSLPANLSFPLKGNITYGIVVPYAMITIGLAISEGLSGRQSCDGVALIPRIERTAVVASNAIVVLPSMSG